MKRTRASAASEPGTPGAADPWASGQLGCSRRGDYDARMILAHWPAFLACGAQAMLALLSLRARDPLGAPLALFGADLFVWNFANLAHDVSGLPIWLKPTASSA